MESIDHSKVEVYILDMEGYATPKESLITSQLDVLMEETGLSSEIIMYMWEQIYYETRRHPSM